MIRYIMSKIREFNKEVDSNIEIKLDFDSVKTLEQDREQKYHNGISLMKYNIKNTAKSDTALEYDRILKQTDDMFTLAKEESAEQIKLRELKESIYVYKGSDIKSDQDHEKMLDKRIKMYQDLHSKKLERQLMRDIRKAKKENSLELYEKLLGEYKIKYGKSRRT